MKNIRYKDQEQKQELLESEEPLNYKIETNIISPKFYKIINAVKIIGCIINLISLMLMFYIVLHNGKLSTGGVIFFIISTYGLIYLQKVTSNNKE